jgi:hypothetical protein
MGGTGFNNWRLSMKRSNKFLIGTVLLLLIAALVFMQSMNKTEKPVDPDAPIEPASAPEAGQQKPTTAEDLQQQIGGNKTGGPFLPGRGP